MKWRLIDNHGRSSSALQSLFVVERRGTIAGFRGHRTSGAHNLQNARYLSALGRRELIGHGLNLGDCLHYAYAKFYGVPILATADEFRQTDLETVP